VRTVCEPIFNKPLKDISFGQVLVRLFETARRFNMEIQPQLVLLEKTLLNIEGLGRQLYPELDLWKTAQPILRDWMRERVSGRAIVERLRSNLPELAEAAKSLPQLIQGVIQQAADGRFRLQVDSPGIEELKRTVRETNARRDAITVAGVLLLGGIVWVAIGHNPGWPGWLLAATGALWLFGVWRR
jgi:ubiquinone biosynthesis protein